MATADGAVEGRAMKEEEHVARNAASGHEENAPAMLLSPTEECERMEYHDR